MIHLSVFTNLFCCASQQVMNKIKKDRDFSGSPVKTQAPNAGRGMCSIPGHREQKILHVLGATKNKNKKTKKKKVETILKESICQALNYQLCPVVSGVRKAV